MTNAVTRRRAFIAGLTGALFADSVLGGASLGYKRSDIDPVDAYQELFGTLLPPDIHPVAYVTRLGLVAAVYEGECVHPAYGPMANRWLCLANQVDEGFQVEVFENVLGGAGFIFETKLTIDDSGTVEVFEQAARWNSRQRWSCAGSNWVFGGRHTFSANERQPETKEDSLRLANSSCSKAGSKELAALFSCGAVPDKPCA